ncbi:solute carrier family 49 member A3 isoform X1 [Xenopus laevis]|uniref:Solute carrier family 49 member A3 isoform X1 n=1 Tax=Xenopus laevis TaxID=8355 RepID=A0A8J1KPS7_XENLA|nr:solute carrier family 49 member A3 isoform X1 [Xenopus laevis]XP_041418748.1 solute carrier family 49 member A3 isoform X1 [Xenopus laevis]
MLPELQFLHPGPMCEVGMAEELLGSVEYTVEQDGQLTDHVDIIVPNRDGCPLRTYKRRWLVLSAVCLLNCTNAMLWMSFAPVADMTASFFQCSLDVVNYLSLVYLIISIPVGFGASWMIDTLGLKCAIVFGSWINMIGSIIRCAAVVFYLNPFGTYTGIYYLFTGQSLCAIAQPLVLFAPAKLAAVWFPDHQRATAHMIASVSYDKAYIIQMLCFGAGVGIFSAILSFLEQILCFRGYSNVPTKKFKEVVKICSALTALASIAFALVLNFRDQTILVASVCSLFGLFGLAISPVVMELAVECTYPVGEGSSTGLMFISGFHVGDGCFVLLWLLHLYHLLSYGVQAASDYRNNGQIQFHKKCFLWFIA